MSKPLVNIKKPYYTMATVDNDTAEITMYGDIVEQQPTDWWGDPIEGSYITQSEFLKDLEQISRCKNIIIRMNSCGGDAGVSILIHNRLRDLASNGANLTCIVDGMAMSGGSLIMCACDTVKVNPSSLIMIHKCWSFLFGGYNADELRSMAKSNDAYDKSQVSIYKRKSGLSDTVLLHMMADTTYMTGKEAIEKGFADEILEDAEPLDIAASADGRSIFVRGRQMHLCPGMFVPDSIPTVKAAPIGAGEINKNPSGNPESQEGGKTMAKTVAELRKEYPELTAQLEDEIRAAVSEEIGDSAVKEAVQAERDRIQKIDEIGAMFDSELVQAAKYGDDACDAAELSYRAAQRAAKNGQSFMANLNADADASNADDVGAVPTTEDEPTGNETPEQKQEQARKDVHALLHGGKKEG